MPKEIKEKIEDWEKISKVAIKNNVPKEWFIKAGTDFLAQALAAQIKQAQKEVLEGLLDGWDTKIVSLLTETGTKIDGVNVVPLSQILNRIKQKLTQLKKRVSKE